MNRKELESRSKKASLLMDSIQTPSGKAMAGDVQNIVNEVLNVKKIDDVLLYFGNIFSATQDVTKLDKSNSKKSVFAKMVDYIGKGNDDNIYSIIKSVNKELSTQTGMLKSVFFEKSEDSGLVKAVVESLDKQTSALKDAISKINTGKKDASSAPVMTGNQEATETMKAMSGVSVDNAKAISMAVDALQKLSYTNLSDFREALIIPIEGFAGLKFDDFKNSIGSFISSEEAIDDLLQRLKSIQLNSNIDNNALNNIFSSIREFSLTMQSLSDMSSEFSPENTEKFIETLAKTIGDEKQGIINVVDRLQGLKPVPDSAKDTINGLAYIAGILTQLTEIADKEMTDAMYKSIKALITVIKESVSEFSKIKQKDIDKAKVTIDSYTQFSTELVIRTKEYSENLRQSKANLDKSKDDTDAIFDRMDYTSDRSRESREKADEAVVTNKKDMSMEGVGKLIVASVAVLLIGYWAITKYPDLLKQSVRFAGTLAIFMAITVGTLVSISAIGGKLGASMKALENIKGIIGTCTLVMLVGALFMTIGNGKLVRASLAFGVVLTMFIAMVLLPFVIFNRLIMSVAVETEEENASSLLGSKKKKTKRKHNSSLGALSSIIVSCAIIMMIGALFMLIDSGKLPKAALQFGGLLSIFIAMVVGTVSVFGFRRDKQMDNIAKVINGCAVIMMVGALFVLIGGGKLVKAALKFGAILSFFIAMVLLPFFIFGRWLVSAGAESEEKDTHSIFSRSKKKGKRNKSPMEALYDIVVSSAIILMVGGIFMTLFNGRLAEGALKFAMLLGGFIVLVGLALVLVTKFISSKAVSEILFFKNSVVMFSLILMMGALLMMFPEFPIHAIGFGILILAFTVLMGVVFALITRMVSAKTIKDITFFALAVVLLGGILLAGGYLMKFIEPKDILIFGGIVLAFVFVMTFVIQYVVNHLNGKEMLKAVETVALFAGIIILLGISFFVMGIAMKIITLKDILKMGLMVGGFIAIFAIFLIPYVTAAVSAASVAVGLMSLALIAICGAFLIVHWMMSNPNWDPMDDIERLKPVLWSYEWLFTKLSIMFPFVYFAGIATTAMGVALAAVAGAIWLTHIAVAKENGIDIIAETKTLSIAIGIYSLLFAALGLLSADVILAFPAAVGMSLTLVLLAGSFRLVDWIVSSSPDLLEHILFMTAIIGMLTLFFSLAGLLAVPIILASAAFITMAVSLTLLSLSFKLIDLMVDDENIQDMNNIENAPLMKKVKLMKKLIRSMLGLFSLVGIPVVAVLITIASAAFISMSVAIMSMSLAVKTITDVIKLAGNIDTKDVEHVGTIIKDFLTSLRTSIEARGLLKVLAVVATLTTIILPVSLALGLMAQMISNIANLKYATDWDDRGNPIDFHVMKQQDFKSVKDNVKIMVNTIIEALDAVVNGKFKTEIEEIGKLGMLKMMFGATNNKLIAGIRVSFMLSRLIGNLATNISAIAGMQFPKKCNQEGIPTEYEKMKQQDFKDAGDGIVEILKVVMDGIKEWMKDDEVQKLIEDYQNNDGNWLTGRGKSKFSTAMKMAMGIGTMIGSLATGVKQYAELKVPVYDDKGNIKTYKPLDETDFTNASNHISDILTNMTLAVEKAYGKYENHRDSVLEEFFMVIERTSGLLGEAAKANIDAASLRFTDLDGQPQEFSDPEFKKSEDNIVKILTTIPKGVRRAIPDIGNVGNADDITKVIKPTGEVITSIVTAIQNYANLKIPTGYDSKGNPTGYMRINLDDDLKKIGDNMSAILTGMMNAVGTAYEKFSKGEDGKEKFDNKSFKDIMDNIGKIGSSFKSIIEAVQSYADLKIATGYKEDGTATGYVSMFGKDNKGKSTDSLIKEYFKKMQTNLVAIVTAFTNVFNDKKLNDAVKNFKNKNQDDILEPISKCGEVIKEVIQAVKDYSELKIPMGGFDRDGKPVGGYASLDGVRIVLMKDRITWLLQSIPAAINDAYGSMFNETNTLDDFKGNVTNMDNAYEECSKLITKVSKNIVELANMKIATGFDKQGNATGYVAMGGQNTMENFRKNIINILTAIPESIKLTNDILTNNNITKETFKFISSVLDDGAVTLMRDSIPGILNAYVEVKPSIDKSKDMGKDIRGVITNIIEAYDSFKDLVMTKDVMVNPEVFEQSISDTNKATKTLESYIKAMLKYADKTDYFGTKMETIADSIKHLNTELQNMYNLSNTTVLTIKRLSTLATSSIITKEKLNEIKTKLNNVGENIVLLYAGITNPFRRRTFNRKSLVEMSMGIEQMSKSMLNTMINFDEAAKIADTINTLSFFDIGHAIRYINSAYVIPATAERNAAIIEKESESLEKFVKNVNSLDLQKTRALTSLMEQMMDMTTSVKDLNEFIKVIRDELTNAITSLAKETQDAKVILNKTDEQKKKRQKDLENTIEKIEKLMNKTLKVNVSSSSIDKYTLNSAYETPAD